MAAPSGKFVIRIDPRLHAELRAVAAREGVSLNDVCCRRLTAEPGRTAPGAEFAALVEQALRFHGSDLIGLALYGSWARGTAVASSDVDLLVVLRHGCPVLRQAYRLWDEAPLRVEGWPVSPAIVTLPKLGEQVSGFWAEIATDGLPIWWVDPSLQAYLVHVRSLIAGGLLRREKSHGQTYWVHKREVA